jgi:hypothetical protein
MIQAIPDAKAKDGVVKEPKPEAAFDILDCLAERLQEWPCLQQILMSPGRRIRDAGHGSTHLSATGRLNQSVG